MLTPRIMKADRRCEFGGLVALAIGRALGGILGALVAVPSAAIVCELAEEYLMKPSRRAQDNTLRCLSGTASTGVALLSPRAI